MNWIRSKLSTRVNCWFCNENCYVSLPNRNSWNCAFCGQYNGFNKDGDYNRPITAQYDNSQNAVSRVGEILHDSSIRSGSRRVWKSENGLCEACNCNQNLKVKRLAAFSPVNENNYTEEVEAYAAYLEKLYQLCTRCATVVSSRLRQTETWLKSNQKGPASTAFPALGSSRMGFRRKSEDSFRVSAKDWKRILTSDCPYSIISLLSIVSCIASSLMVVVSSRSFSTPFLHYISSHLSPASKLLGWAWLDSSLSHCSSFLTSSLDILDSMILEILQTGLLSSAVALTLQFVMSRVVEMSYQRLLSLLLWVTLLMSHLVADLQDESRIFKFISSCALCLKSIDIQRNFTAYLDTLKTSSRRFTNYVHTRRSPTQATSHANSSDFDSDFLNSTVIKDSPPSTPTPPPTMSSHVGEWMWPRPTLQSDLYSESNHNYGQLGSQLSNLFINASPSRPVAYQRPQAGRSPTQSAFSTSSFPTVGFTNGTRFDSSGMFQEYPYQQLGGNSSRMNPFEQSKNGFAPSRSSSTSSGLGSSSQVESERTIRPYFHGSLPGSRAGSIRNGFDSGSVISEPANLFRDDLSRVSAMNGYAGARSPFADKPSFSGYRSSSLRKQPSPSKSFTSSTGTVKAFPKSFSHINTSSHFIEPASKNVFRGIVGKVSLGTILFIISLISNCVYLTYQYRDEIVTSYLKWM